MSSRARSPSNLWHPNVASHSVGEGTASQSRSPALPAVFVPAVALVSELGVVPAAVVPEAVSGTSSRSQAGRKRNHNSDEYSVRIIVIEPGSAGT